MLVELVLGLLRRVNLGFDLLRCLQRLLTILRLFLDVIFPPGAFACPAYFATSLLRAVLQDSNVKRRLHLVGVWVTVTH